MNQLPKLRAVILGRRVDVNYMRAVVERLQIAVNIPVHSVYHFTIADNIMLRNKNYITLRQVFKRLAGLQRMNVDHAAVKSCTSKVSALVRVLKFNIIISLRAVNCEHVKRH